MNSQPPVDIATIAALVAQLSVALQGEPYFIIVVTLLIVCQR